MHANSTYLTDVTYSDAPPVVVAASSGAAMDRAEMAIRASGLRVAAELPLELVQDRMAQQVALSALWIELDDDCGIPMDKLLIQTCRDVANGRYPAVVSATSALIDALAARLDESAVELIVDADDAQRAAALAIATARAGLPLRLSDVSSDRNAERLRQLSDEVSRIASTLARLSTTPLIPGPPLATEAESSANIKPISAETIRSVIRARRLRSHYFRDELFADPAWDMMLDLLQAEIAQLRVPVSSLCIAAAVPATTALRWLKAMVDEGIFIRRADPYDGRRVFVELAPAASEGLRRYFSEICGAAVI